MAKKAIVNIDLGTMTGTMQFVPPQNPMPRRDNAELEMRVAGELISVIRSASSHLLENLRPNHDDPPDVLVDVDGGTIGIELTEILPPNRLERDHVLASFRNSVIQQLNVGEQTRNRVVRIFMVDCYAEKLRPRRFTKPLARLLNEFFATDSARQECSIPVTDELAGLISRIIIQEEDLTGDPRITQPDHPLIIFDAQDTLIVPEDDVPRMLEAALRDKFAHDVDETQWLLVWSNHPVIASVRQEITQGIGQCVALCAPRYGRIFYLDLAPPGHVWHWAIAPEEKRLFDRKDARHPSV